MPVPEMDERDVAAWRKARRAALIAARLALPAAWHREASDAVMRNLAGYLVRPGQLVPSGHAARRSIGFYWPVRGEIDPLPVVEQLIAAGATAALPVLVERDGPLLFRTWRPGAPMASDAYGIPYPTEGDTISPTLLLVALVGFDEAGYRLGYGGGYYDRTIAALPAKPETIAIGFELGRLATIYPQRYDIAMDVIATEHGIWRSTPRGLTPL